MMYEVRRGTDLVMLAPLRTVERMLNLHREAVRRIRYECEEHNRICELHLRGEIYYVQRIVATWHPYS